MKSLLFGCSVVSDCDCKDCSVPGFPVLQYLLQFAQTHIHWVVDAIQPSHPLSLLSPFASSLSQYQGLFQWVGSSHQVAKVLELQLQHHLFQRVFKVDFLKDWLIWSPCCRRDSQEPSPTPEFKSINYSAFSLHCGPTLTSIHDYWRYRRFGHADLCWQSDGSAF